MTSILTPPNTYAAESLSAGFKNKLPADVRYVAIRRMGRPPVLALNQKNVEFRLPAISDIYLINNMKLELKVSIKTKTPPHTTPAEGAKVAPVNNLLHSCIKDVNILFNNNPREFECH